MNTYKINLFTILVVCVFGILLFGITTESASEDKPIDSPLEQEIDGFIKQYRIQNKLTNTDKTSFVVYDLYQNKKLVSINEDTERTSASLIKNFVMLVYFHEVKQGRLSHTNTNRQHLKRMIGVSSNTSTNYFINLIGGPNKVNRILKANYGYFKQTRIEERIPATGRTDKNTTSAQDLNKFYIQLWDNKLPFSDKMNWYFGLQNGDYIYKRTSIPTSVKGVNKTGTVYRLIKDSGILVLRDPIGNPRPYVFIKMIEDETKTNNRLKTE
ncbi:serine hydrolase [Candidatus Poribacteria bacterium]|nr:serine hydrolase [Candidatus Poribacteria bacterium]